MTCYRIFLDDRYEEFATNSDARLIPFISVSTDPRFMSDGLVKLEELPAQYVEQYYVPC